MYVSIHSVQLYKHYNVCITINFFDFWWLSKSLFIWISTYSYDVRIYSFIFKLIRHCDVFIYNLIWARFPKSLGDSFKRPSLSLFCRLSIFSRPVINDLAFELPSPTAAYEINVIWIEIFRLYNPYIYITSNRQNSIYIMAIFSYRFYNL